MMRKKRPASMDDKRRMEALNQAKEIRMKRGRNPRMAAQPLKANVESEMGNPGVTAQGRMDRDRASKMAMDKFMKRKFDKLPRLSEVGGPKEDLEDISGQLGKASKLHGDQSKRVGKIAAGMKSETGNPYMKRSKSKYGM